MVLSSRKVQVDYKRQMRTRDMQSGGIAASCEHPTRGCVSKEGGDKMMDHRAVMERKTKACYYNASQTRVFGSALFSVKEYSRKSANLIWPYQNE